MDYYYGWWTTLFWYIYWTFTFSGSITIIFKIKLTNSNYNNLLQLSIEYDVRNLQFCLVDYCKENTNIKILSELFEAFYSNYNRISEFENCIIEWFMEPIKIYLGLFGNLFFDKYEEYLSSNILKVTIETDECIIMNEEILLNKLLNYYISKPGILLYFRWK